MLDYQILAMAQKNDETTLKKNKNDHIIPFFMNGFLVIHNILDFWNVTKIASQSIFMIMDSTYSL